MRRQLTVWAGGFVAALLVFSATAAPPFFSEQNRTYGNWIGGGVCTDIENGMICRDVYAWDNYDVKRTYQNSEASINFYLYEFDPSDGSWRSGWRYLTCPVDSKAITALPKRVHLEAIIDSAAAGCYTDGYMDMWDPINGYQSFPWPYPPGPREIAGDWIDPTNHGSSTVNRHDSFHDGWSGTTQTTVQHCKERWGELMNDGHFYINGRFFPFDGPDGPAWSFFHVMSCNDNNKSR